jgi:hypothetical protein
VDDVVGFAQTGWPITAGEAASAVAGDQGAADAQGDGALGATDIEGFGVPAQDDGDEFAVAGDAPGSGSTDQLPVVEHGGAQPDRY